MFDLIIQCDQTIINNKARLTAFSSHRKTLIIQIKVRSLFKDGKQTAGCTNFCTETRLRRPVSVRNSVHPAVCLPSLKRERTLGCIIYKIQFYPPCWLIDEEFCDSISKQNKLSNQTSCFQIL